MLLHLCYGFYLLSVCNVSPPLVFGSPEISASELQIHKNRIFIGENSLMGFGQTAALLLALVPLWSLTVALYKYPFKIQQRRRNRRREAQLEYERQHANRGRRPTLDSNLTYPNDSISAPTHYMDPDAGVRDTLRPPMMGAHGRSPSDSSIVSDTAPLIADNIPRMDNTWRRTPWSYSDSDSDSDEE
jgi:hypothetical protein